MKPKEFVLIMFAAALVTVVFNIVAIVLSVTGVIG